jgi:hypothetical protein
MLPAPSTCLTVTSATRPSVVATPHHVRVAAGFGRCDHRHRPLSDRLRRGRWPWRHFMYTYTGIPPRISRKPLVMIS